MSEKISSSSSYTLRRSFLALNSNDKKKVTLILLIQVSLGLLDLIGIALMGFIGSLAVTGISSRQTGNRVTLVLEFFGIDKYSLQAQITILGILATVILISRTLLSIFFMRRAYFFLSRKGAVLTEQLVSKILARSILKLQEKTTQETLYQVTTGVNTVTLGILGVGISLIADLSLVGLMLIGLLIADPVIALSTVLLFGVLGGLLYKALHKRVRVLGASEAKYDIASREFILESLGAFRENIVRSRQSYFVNEIGKSRRNLAEVLAELSFMPNINKYIIESAVIIGALVITGIQFAFLDASHAVATLSIFLAASTRIAPASLRIQQGALQIRGNLGSAESTLDLIEELSNSALTPINVNSNIEVEHEGFNPEVNFENVTFSYPNSSTSALRDINLTIESGTVVAIVGGSGAGKSTLVDAMLGILKPSLGSVQVSNLPPLDSIAKWPGAIGYVPQDVLIVNGTVLRNVALGFEEDLVNEALAMKALSTAQLSELIQTLPDGIHSQVGERGTLWSGGQRQRLGIARALFTSPKLLVFDEATSSLDGQTESDVSEAIKSLRGSATIVLIAHRLSTAKNADKVVYLEDGKILSTGTFEEVRAAVPQFDQQVKLSSAE